mmetsp:Transcript_52799/g.114099  ORF Transcript_52799/g.114099 Transcript_52799/m.114099 type:complete len:521 (-) Transcript_52799:331-1893(-)
MLKNLFKKLLQSPEAIAVDRLLETHSRLVFEGDSIDVKSSAGSTACADYFCSLDLAARALRIDAASREYRLSFTSNYRALFLGETRNYRIDVFAASLGQHAAIWVNGDRFEFSDHAMDLAEDLQRHWKELDCLLDHWAVEDLGEPMQAERIEGLGRALAALDAAWAQFEHNYVLELMGIEEKSMQCLVQAVQHECALQLLEKQCSEEQAVHVPGYAAEFQGLVRCISRLNSLANFQGKGRDDLSVDVINVAVQLRKCNLAENRADFCSADSPAQTLAADVVDSFNAVREYLREVHARLEWVDPQLRNNSGLVARLCDWEQSWERGRRYVQNRRLLESICDLVEEIRSAERLVPELSAMCKVCDAELFGVLPRLLLLRFLDEPAKQQELLQSLLPHRFVEDQQENSGFMPGAELRALARKLGKMRLMLIGGLPLPRLAGAASTEVEVQLILIRRVVIGLDYDKVQLGSSATESIEDFLRDLGTWSMELQRHCPDDWNGFCAILMRCLTRECWHDRKGPFGI